MVEPGRQGAEPSARSEINSGPAEAAGQVEGRLTLADNDLARSLFGPGNSHLSLLHKLVGAKIHVRGGQVRVVGDQAQVDLAVLILRQLYDLLAEGYPLYANDVEFAARILSHDDQARLKSIFLDNVFISSKKRNITPKSVAQKFYIEAIRHHDLVFGIGPAGTGKTYLAMAMAVAALTGGQARRIILTRPAVEAGEKLGFLPGDLYEKVNPYLRPLYDALHDMLDFERASGLVSKGIIEVAPLAFMRGRTLNDAFVILDEAQNTTGEQMKMFLTRMGFSSKCVVTGDVTQIDLPPEQRCGLLEAERILKGVEGISFVYFTHRDVIRHPLVQKIISAYDRAEAEARRTRPARGERAPGLAGEARDG